MQLHQYRTDGHLDVTELSLTDVAASKFTALSLVANPRESGVYRVKFVDAEYDRTSWDSYHAAAPVALGTVVFAGAS
jgi:hypothetical protein